MNSMKISAISDVHVKKPHDQADRLLRDFLLNPIVKSSDYIVLLFYIIFVQCLMPSKYNAYNFPKIVVEIH